MAAAGAPDPYASPPLSEVGDEDKSPGRKISIALRPFVSSCGKVSSRRLHASLIIISSQKRMGISGISLVQERK
jgi:hypothetical protein